MRLLPKASLARRCLWIHSKLCLRSNAWAAVQPATQSSQRANSGQAFGLLEWLNLSHYRIFWQRVSIISAGKISQKVIPKAHVFTERDKESPVHIQSTNFKLTH